jgi:hypothetical protein
MSPYPIAFPGQIIPVDARTGPVTLIAPYSPQIALPMANWEFGVLDVYGIFGVNPCRVNAYGSGVTIWNGSAYAAYCTLLGTGGTTYFKLLAEIMGWTSS